MSLLDGLTKSLVSLYAEKLSQQEQAELMECLEVIASDQKYNKFKNFFPDEGEYRRELYPKHIAFFDAGKSYTERFFLAANRIGKSEAGAFETVCHVTGIYPEWWTGLRFNKPVLAWVGGDTATTCRDIIQKKLIGDDILDMGSGMLPKDTIIAEKCKTRRNVPDAMEILKIRHLSGGESTIVIKTYEQGRATWQGTEVDWIWVDEECPEEVYSECLIRLMTTNGSIITTFTPLSGLTPLVLSALENSQDTDVEFPKYVQVVAWKDVPHITEEMKAKMLASTPPQLREARSEGKPTVGSGLIYPIETSQVTVDDFKIPKHYMKAYGMDVGWKATAALFGAWDRDNDIIYIYSEYKRGGEEGLDMPLVHADSIKSRGSWMKGVIDPASRGRSQVDGEKLYITYKKHGLKVYPAKNAVDSGIYNVWERLNSGRLKIFKSCSMILREMGLYHRDEKGQIVKTNDHLLDCLRYLCLADQAVWSYQQEERQQNKVVSINNYMQACV